MIIDLQAWATNNRVLIKAPQADLHIDLANIIALNKTNNKIVAVGKTEAEMKEQSKLGWRLHKDKIKFVAPFATNAFKPEVAKLMLMFYAYRAAQQIRPGTFGQLISMVIDRFSIDLRISDYENVPSDQRDEFEELMQKDRVIDTLIINGQRLKG